MATAKELLAIMNEDKTKLTLRDLLTSSITVYGYTHKQDRTIKLLKTQPSPGTKWIRFDGEALGSSLYPLAMIFYKVDFGERSSSRVLPIRLMDNQLVWAEKMNVDKHPVRVFCGCPNFQFYCEWYLAKNGSLAPSRRARPYKRVPGSTRPPVNPKQLPCVCKHIYQMALELQKRGILIHM